MRHHFVATLVVTAAVTAVGASGQAPLFNPYERPKNGPPLTDVFNKLRTPWLWHKIRDPRHHSSARMPDFAFTEEEALDVVAFLQSIAHDPPAEREWPPWAAKDFDELDDDEFDAVLQAVDRGQVVWSRARCTICHRVNGPSGALIGGFADLRVGGIDLYNAAQRLRREWIFGWIQEPKDYFPDTLMPRFRFTEDELRALVEYILRDDAFAVQDGEAPEMPDRLAESADPARVQRGKKLVEVSRCVVCHDISGVREVLPMQGRPPVPEPGTFEYLAYDLRCLSCHTDSGRGGTYAPDLTSVGSRLQEPWIARFLASPDMIRPLSQQMPRFNLALDEAAIIATHLSSTRIAPAIPTESPGGPLQPEDVQRGREVFRRRGCVSCHTTDEGPGGVVGPSLEAAGDRLRQGYIWFHLKNPHAVNAFSAEPDMGLSDEQARALTAFLGSARS